MKIVRLAAFGAAVFALALPAYPAGLTGDAPGFNELDANNDGALSRAEAKANASLASAFDKVDDDKSGTLSRMEYLGHMTAKDFRVLREKTADFIDPGKGNDKGKASSGGTR